MLQMDILVSLLTHFLRLQQLFIIRFAFVSWSLFADAKPKIRRPQHCSMKKSESLKEILVYLRIRVNSGMKAGVYVQHLQGC
jgi:hypothetical protein